MTVCAVAARSDSGLSGALSNGGRPEMLRDASISKRTTLARDGVGSRRAADRVRSSACPNLGGGGVSQRISSPKPAARGSLGSLSATVGRIGEIVARDFLWANGHRVVATNARVGHDELDIISLDPRGTLVFTEVRSYRKRSPNHATGLATLRGAKLERWGRAARAWHRMHAEYTGHACRFDAIAVDLEGPARVSHVRGVFLAFRGTQDLSNLLDAYR